MRLLISTPHAMVGSGLLEVYTDVCIEDVDAAFDDVRVQVQEAREQGRQVGLIKYPSAGRPGIFTYAPAATDAVESGLITNILSGPTARTATLACYGGGA